MQRVGRCRCRECVRSGSSTLLSYYLRKKHEKQHGLATDDTLVTNASSEMNQETLEPTGHGLIDSEGSEESEGTESEANLIENSQVPSSDCESGSESSTSMVAGP